MQTSARSLIATQCSPYQGAHHAALASHINH
jgi:hypothetical protein